MLGLYFGNYLMGKGVISQAQFDVILQQQQKTSVKLGLIAVSEKLLTVKQADEINEIQRRMDKRFGDIAIEKGYLLPEEVTYLLNLQGNPYLKFVQTCTEHNIITVQELEAQLEAFRIDNGFTKQDIHAFKSGDIDRILSAYVDIDNPFAYELISLAVRNLIRLVNKDLVLNKVTRAKVYSFGSLASQQMIGDQDIFVGLACKDRELLTVANSFAKEEFNEMDEESFDSICEFINCTNGLYASKLSFDDVLIDMTPPLSYSNQTAKAKDNFYVVPMLIDDKQVDLLVTVSSQVEII